ncbi:MAG TPA: hypothetical protein VFL93_14535 [Longimicrobiaceae bacterium]|nr:hypothetical protein [Longimicrobiaceae bacterium]
MHGFQALDGDVRVDLRAGEVVVEEAPADQVRAVAALASALHASADELLGIQPLQERLSPSVVRLRKRLRKAEALPPEDQKALLTLVEALLQRRGVA